MRNLPLYLTGLLVVAIGVFAVYQNNQIGHQRRIISTLQQRVVAAEKNVSDVKKAAYRLAAENQAFIAESAVLRGKLAGLSTTLEAPADNVPEVREPTVFNDLASKSGFGGMVDKMLKDPKMMDAIAAQQMVLLKPMYADFIKQLKLSPEQADAFYEVLATETSKAMEAGMKLLSGDEKAMDEIIRTPNAMQALLGEKYPQYETYQKSVPDRTMLSQINTQMAARQTPLRPDQSTGLLQIMQQEPINTAKFASANADPRNTNFDDKTIDDTYNAMADRNARILARSKTLLTPEQWQAYSEQQQQTLQMQKMGMDMAKSMMPK